MRTRLQTLVPFVLALALVSLLVTPLVVQAQEPVISLSSETARPGSADTVPQAVAAEVEPGPAPVASPSGNTTGDIAVLLIIAVVLGGVAFGGVVVLRGGRDDSPPGMGKGDDLIWGGGSAEGPVQTATDEPHWKTAQTTTQPAQTES